MRLLLLTRTIPGFKFLSYIVLKIIGLEIPMKVKIGKNVRFEHWAYGTVIHPNTTIEDNVKIYQGVTLGRADIYKEYKDSQMKKIIIKKGAILCAGSKILCRDGILTVGENSVIAANAVLFRDTGNNEIWGGIPAHKLSSIRTKE